MSLKGLHRNYIKRRLRHNHQFRGVVSRRVLQHVLGKHLQPQQSVILLHRHHYTSLVLAPNGKICFYFDPLGISRLSKNVLHMLRTLDVTTVYYNKKPVQSSQSDKCGLFCMYFVVENIRNPHQFQTFLNTFSTVSRKNDQLVQYLLGRKI